MRRTINFAILISIIFLSAAAAVESAGELTDAGKKLNEATVFAVGQTEKGYVSLQEIALRELLTEKYAESSFKYIIRNGTPEGKLYALLGLRLMRCDCFAEQLEDVKKAVKFRGENVAEAGVSVPEIAPAGKVRFQSGCEVGLEDFLEIVNRIAEGKFDRILEDKVDKEGRIVR